MRKLLIAMLMGCSGVAVGAQPASTPPAATKRRRLSYMIGMVARRHAPADPRSAANASYTAIVGDMATSRATISAIRS